MAAPWLYISGAVLAFSALLAKTRGVHQAYTNPDLDFIHVTSCDIMGTLGALYSLNLTVLLVWTFLSPLEWNRVFRDSTDMFDRPFESYGICSNNDALPYVIVILVLNITILIAANWWAYQSRNIETEYHESRYVGISMASILQAWCMGIPILIVVWDNPQAKFFVEAGIVFVTALAVLLLVFVPKMLAIHADRVKAAEESKRIAYTNFTARSRRNQFVDMEEEDDRDKTAKTANALMLDDIIDKDTSESSPDERKSGLDLSSEIHPETARRSRVESSLDEEPNMQTLRGTIAQSIRSLHATNKNNNGTNNNSNGVGNKPIISNSLNASLSMDAAIGGGPSGGVGSGGGSGVLPASGSSLSSSLDLDGLRVTHNPRSARNLKASGGIEYSRAQLEQLEQMHQEGPYLRDGDLEDVEESDDDMMIETLDPLAAAEEAGGVGGGGGDDGDDDDEVRVAAQ